MTPTVKPFTVRDGLFCQFHDLERLKRVLAPTIYQKLEEACAKQYGELPSTATGYDVLRGQDLLNLVINYSYETPLI